MPNANLRTEFFVNGEWVLYSTVPVSIDSYENIKIRQSAIDLPHITRAFYDTARTKTETRTIRDNGETAVVRETITWF